MLYNTRQNLMGKLIPWVFFIFKFVDSSEKRLGFFYIYNTR
jgi:hypothetical protein